MSIAQLLGSLYKLIRFFTKSSVLTILVVPHRPMGYQPCIQVAGMSNHCALMLDTVGSPHGQAEFLFPPLHRPYSFA